MYLIVFANEDFKDINFFKKAHSFFINNNFVCETTTSYLEITSKTDNNIYRIEDEEQINNFRKSDIMPNINYIKKYKKQINKLDNEIDTNEYNYTCSIKNIDENEETIDDESLNFLSELKLYQIKKDFIYKNVKQNIYYKCEVLNYNTKLSKSFKNTKIESKNPKYIFSIISDNIIENTDFYIRQMHFILDNNVIPLKKKKQETILLEYKKLISTIFTNTKIFKKVLEDEIIMLAPKPSTLEKFNLANINILGAVTIFDNYAVSEKADGDRFLMYIDNNSDVFLIEVSIKQVRGCNIKTKLKNCLLDGELILCQCRKTKNNKDLFAIFDIYYFNNVKVIDKNLINSEGSRYDLMNKVVESLYDKVSHDIVVKKQLVGDKNNDILSKCKDILENPIEYDYDIDGLIFTPIKIPVFGTYANKPVEIQSTNLSWNKVLKWKPPQQNTIDFVVKETNRIDVMIDGKKYKEYVLHVVYNYSSMDPITIIKGLKLTNSGKDKINNRDLYDLKEFLIDDVQQTVFIEVINNRCYTIEHNDEIINNSVVEFAYDNESPALAKQRRWLPLRIRHDKNKVYNFGTGVVNKTANNFVVAMNIWRSILNPVSENMIKGTDKIIDKDINNYLSSNDKYYSRNVAAKNLISGHMNLFHNNIIKHDLYKTSIENKSKSLLELCCGQGSDINRWINSDFKFVLGIDYVLDNISNPTSGIYKRYINAINKKYYQTNKIIMVFAAGDCSKPIRNGKCSDNIDNESKNLLKHIFDRPNTEFSNILKKGILPKQYDLISCMFSIHYFFDSESKLDGFIKNIVENLAPGGKVILTFMDKDLVNALFNKHKDKAIGRDIQSDAVVWAIICEYNKHQSDVYNKKINVFIENTGKLITENIVDFDTLKSKFGVHNINLIESETFKETFYKKIADTSTILPDKEILNNLNANEMLKEFSFLNRWAIFQKS